MTGALLAPRVVGIPHLAHRMGLRHQSLQVVDEPVAAVLGVLVVPAEVNGLLGAYFLTRAAENASKLVDLEDQRVAVALLVLPGHELDAVGWAHGRAQTAGHALGL